MNGAPGQPQRILVIKLGALGDVVQALGPMAAIRRHHTMAHITVLTTRPFADLIGAAKVADDVWIDDRPGPINLPGWLSLRSRLRRGDFDRVYDLQTSGRSGRYFRLFWPDSPPQWSGIATGCSHPHDNPRRDFMHTQARQAEQLAAAGIAAVDASDLSGIDADLSRFALPETYCLIVPGGAEHRPEKRWSMAHYRDIVRRLGETPCAPVICGGADERALGDAIANNTPAARNLAGETSLIELVALARGAAFALGNDSGPMHIAAATGTPSIVLYSHASDPALCAQRGPDVTILRRPDLADLTPDAVWATLPAAALL